MESKIIKIDYSPLSLSKNTHDMIQKVDQKMKIIRCKRPFEGEMLRQIKDFYKIDTVWSSEALEGNSLTIGETKVLLEDGITVAGKPLKDVLRTCGHGEAYDYMFTLLHNKKLTIEEICTMHKILLSKERPDIAGIYKPVDNFISGSQYTTIPKDQVPQEMERLAEWMNENENTMHPLVYAAELHRKLVYIHPFQDGNGRTARLAMNTKLIQNSYLPCSISPVIKLDYNNALEAGRRGERDNFIYVIAEAEHETEKDFGRYMNIDFQKDWNEAVEATEIQINNIDLEQ